jgi:hypothetical protein
MVIIWIYSRSLVGVDGEFGGDGQESEINICKERRMIKWHYY